MNAPGLDLARTPENSPRDSRARHRPRRPLGGATVTGTLRSLLHPRGDAETVRVLRDTWPEMNIGWHKARWRAWPRDGSPEYPAACGRTPDELRTAIRAAWIATGTTGVQS